IITILLGLTWSRLSSCALCAFGWCSVLRAYFGLWTVIGNILWILVLGWELAIAHLVAGALLCLTVVGIPLGVACWKMVPLALLPLGQQIVPVRAASEDPFVTAPGRPRSR